MMVFAQISLNYWGKWDKAALCPLIYLSYGVEIFACKIRQDKTIKGITVFQKELKLIQFANDTTLLCNDCNSVNRAITVLNSFGNLSGLRLNPSKTNSTLVTTRTNPLTLSGPKNRLESLEPTFHTMRNKTRNLTLKEKCKNLTPFLAYGTLGTSLFLVGVLKRNLLASHS